MRTREPTGDTDTCDVSNIQKYSRPSFTPIRKLSRYAVHGQLVSIWKLKSYCICLYSRMHSPLRKPIMAYRRLAASMIF